MGRKALTEEEKKQKAMERANRPTLAKKGLENIGDTVQILDQKTGQLLTCTVRGVSDSQEVKTDEAGNETILSVRTLSVQANDNGLYYSLRVVCTAGKNAKLANVYCPTDVYTDENGFGVDNPKLKGTPASPKVVAK